MNFFLSQSLLFFLSVWICFGGFERRSINTHARTLRVYVCMYACTLSSGHLYITATLKSPQVSVFNVHIQSKLW